jgi:hypothetical protein
MLSPGQKISTRIHQIDLIAGISVFPTTNSKKETDTLTASIANKIDNQLRILGKSVPARPLGNDRYCQWVLQW